MLITVQFGSNQQQIFNADVFSDTLLNYIRKQCASSILHTLREKMPRVEKAIRELEAKAHQLAKSIDLEKSRTSDSTGGMTARLEAVEESLEARRKQQTQLKNGLALYEAIACQDNKLDLLYNNVGKQLNEKGNEYASNFLESRKCYILAFISSSTDSTPPVLTPVTYTLDPDP